MTPVKGHRLCLLLIFRAKEQMSSSQPSCYPLSLTGPLTVASLSSTVASGEHNLEIKLTYCEDTMCCWSACGFSEGPSISK